MGRAALVVGTCVLLLGAFATANSAGDARRLVVVTVADNGVAAMPPRGYHRPGYRISDAAANALAGIERDYRVKRVDGWPIELLGVYCAVLAVSSEDEQDAAIARIGADSRVRLAQPMQTFSVRGGYDDPYFEAQFGASSSQLVAMHRRATGRGVRVAIVDTGVDRNHPDLRGRIRTSRNFVAGDTRFDSDIHGTAVAGIIAANAGDGIGIVGIAPDSEVLALKACWQTASEDIRAQCNTLTLAKALTFAIDRRADVINLSLGGPHDPLLQALVEIALARGTVVVAAQDAADTFPADVPGVIAVRTARAHAAADDAAGRTFISTSPGGRYDFFSGSSIAAARVTGLSALMRQERPATAPAQMLAELDRRLMSLAAGTPPLDMRVTRSNESVNEPAPDSATRTSRNATPAHLAVRVGGS